MSSFFNNTWKSLKLSAGSAVDSIVKAGLSYRYQQNGSGNLIYKSSCAYSSVVVYTAKQMAAQALLAETSKLLPKYQQYIENRQRKEFLDKKKALENAVKQAIISNGEAATKTYGDIGDGIKAQDIYGHAVEGALIIWYEGKEGLKESVYTKSNSTTKIDSSKSLGSLYNLEQSKYSETHNIAEIQTKKVYVIDLAPKITMRSSKNLLLTKVQGRDFTRKELISGGDLMFTVSGEINSNFDDVYPHREVKKFLSIMQHSGIVSVNNIMFGNLNIENVLIQDFQLGEVIYKNIQPYSFTCVAVEPNDDIILTHDTIQTLNESISTSPLETWEKLVLDNKLVEITANTAASAINALGNAGLDALIPNI